MNIVLIGYRGTGKSRVARLLAARLGRPVTAMDEEIAAEAGLRIPDIVKKHGWDYFRDMESNVAIKAGKQEKRIIDTGGGVILRGKNIAALRNNGILIWLKATPRTIAERIKDDTGRPSLTGTQSFLEEIEEVLADRIPLYRRAADHEIDTDGCSPEVIAEKIRKIIEKKR